MAIITKGIGKIVKLMAKEFKFIKMGQNTREIGLMTYRKEKVWKHNMTKPFIRANFIRVRNMEKEDLNGRITLSMRDNLATTILRVKDSIIGRTAKVMREIGKITKWKAMEYFHGQIKKNIKVILKKILFYLKNYSLNFKFKLQYNLIKKKKL